MLNKNLGNKNGNRSHTKVSKINCNQYLFFEKIEAKIRLLKGKFC